MTWSNWAAIRNIGRRNPEPHRERRAFAFLLLMEPGLKLLMVKIFIFALLLVGSFMGSIVQSGEGLGPDGWAIAIHTGAGGLTKDMDSKQRKLLEQSLREALHAGKKILASGGSSLDAVEAVVVMLEDDPQFNAGRGAVFTQAGTHELDASIMDGATLNVGGVAAIKFQKNPIKVARFVMERTPHVLLAGLGADDFAKEQGLKPVTQDYFYTEQRFRQLQRAMAKAGRKTLDKPAYPIRNLRLIDDAAADGPSGTVGCVALDSRSNLAAATSTGGLTGKLPGRVGDTPICGAGTYANNKNCAVSCTGKGEQFIRHSIAARVAMLMDEKGLSVNQAIQHCLNKVLQSGDGGIIAVDAGGHVAMHATTETMPRGVADSSGRFEIAIEINHK
jgi:beta-aspartyl-peptidase (threonine type)